MKKLKIVAILTCVMLTAGGCSSGGSQVNSGSKQKIKYSDSEYINLTMVKPKTINPITNTDKSVSYVMNLVYDGLFSIDKNYNVIPKLVEDYTVSSDAKSIEIKLKDARWHNGRSVTPEDVSHTIDLIKKTPDGIYAGLADNIASVRIEGDRSFTILFKTSETFPINELVFPIVPSSNSDMKTINDDAKNMNGSGEYKIKEYSWRNAMILSPNKDYYDKIPKSMRDVKVKIVPDDEARISMVMSLDSDITEVTINDLSKFQEKTFDVTSYEGRDYEFVKFNFEKSYIKDANLRKAIAHSINRKAVFEEGYMGDATRVNFPINSKSEYYDPKVGQLDYNREKAVNYLDKVKFTADEPVTEKSDKTGKTPENTDTSKNNAQPNSTEKNSGVNMNTNPATPSVPTDDSNTGTKNPDSSAGGANDITNNQVGGSTSVENRQGTRSKEVSTKTEVLSYRTKKSSKAKTKKVKKAEPKIKSTSDLNLKIVVNKERGERLKTANIINANLKTIGINSTVEALTADEMEKAMDKNDYDLAITGWTLSNVPDVKSIIDYSGYTDSGLDALKAKIEKGGTKEEVKAIYSKMQKNINQNAGFISLVIVNGHIVSNSRLEGKITPNDFNVYEEITNLKIKN
ncbi:MAG: ABC transporter substrate-binding protein [Clostridioides sp.]|jgi:ABC-type transport system substrate-binding protein|nr:ABC transporter substrate-binding protein [Clostridioides sp.]